MRDASQAIGTSLNHPGPGLIRMVYPADLRGRLAWAGMIHRHRKDPARAIEICPSARNEVLTESEENAVANMLIDLYAAAGDRGRWMAGLARYADRNRGTEEGETARKALLQAKADGEERAGEATT